MANDHFAPCNFGSGTRLLLARNAAHVVVAEDKLNPRNRVTVGLTPAGMRRLAAMLTEIVGEPKRGDVCAEEFGATAGNDSDRDGTFNWGWPMLDVVPITPPEPARGAQGLWDWRT